MKFIHFLEFTKLKGITSDQHMVVYKGKHTMEHVTKMMGASYRINHVSISTSLMVADILYRHEILAGPDRYSLVNCDIFFKDFMSDERGELFIKNANLSQLEEHLL